jgi:hypothetical protein
MLLTRWQEFSLHTLIWICNERAKYAARHYR